MSQIIGHISQVIGPVVDVYFEGKGIDTDLLLPSIHDALTIKRNDGRILVVEVQQHIGEDTVRTVAMDSKITGQCFRRLFSGNRTDRGYISLCNSSDHTSCELAPAC